MIKPAWNLGRSEILSLVCVLGSTWGNALPRRRPLACAMSGECGSALLIQQIYIRNIDTWSQYSAARGHISDCKHGVSFGQAHAFQYKLKVTDAL